MVGSVYKGVFFDVTLPSITRSISRQAGGQIIPFDRQLTSRPLTLRRR
jgi:hypothetical protein